MKRVAHNSLLVLSLTASLGVTTVAITVTSATALAQEQKAAEATADAKATEKGEKSEKAEKEKAVVATVTAETVTPQGNERQAPRISPQAVKMEPKNAKPGTIVTITGVALGTSAVDEVYFTDHRFDMKVKVLEQTDTMLKVRIPPFLKPGRQQLLLLTKGETQVYLEQPFYVLVESKEDDEQVLASTPGKQSSTAEKGASNGNSTGNNPENK